MPMKMNRLIPELDVSDLARSLRFYREVVRCEVVYERPEERFAFLNLEGAQFMLEEAAGPGRRFRTASLEFPFGRGVNFQIQVTRVDALFQHCSESECPIVIQPEEQWYRKDQIELGNRQFVVADPDGYLLRFFEDLGSRKILASQVGGQPVIRVDRQGSH
jgi:catechol 2,3-dioxygenase-like lactoylglutathione lyase family enzyme